MASYGARQPMGWTPSVIMTYKGPPAGGVDTRRQSSASVPSWALGRSAWDELRNSKTSRCSAQTIVPRPCRRRRVGLEQIGVFQFHPSVRSLLVANRSSLHLWTLDVESEARLNATASNFRWYRTTGRCCATRRWLTNDRHGEPDKHQQPDSCEGGGPQNCSRRVLA